MPNIILECKNLYKEINDKEILTNINLKLEEKDILGLIGPNGSGKTTTIKTILSLQKITKGEIFIDNHNIKTDYKNAISQVGAIIENPDLYTYLTGLENLLIPAAIYNINKERIEEVINLVGLSQRINDKVSKYSLGMKQRLGIAQAIIHKPKLLILDEPTNGLDPEGIKELRRLLLKLKEQENMTILISSHNLKELETICNKIAIIKQGKILSINDINILTKKNNNYLFELDTIKINNILDNYKIINNNTIELLIEKEDIPKIVRKLTNNNIKIYMIKEKSLTLEEAYLLKTEGNTIE
jgi:ABC-2 type transport system ATP-binding protein